MPALSPRQFEFARTHREQSWLYVVELAETEPAITRINDPAGRATHFVFDPGWAQLNDAPAQTAEPEPTSGAPVRHTGVRDGACAGSVAEDHRLKN